MKKLLCLALAVLMLFALAACAENKTPETQAPATTQAPETTEAPRAVPSPAEIDAAIAAALGKGYKPTVEVSEEDILMTPIGWMDLSKVKSYVAKQALVSSVDLDTVMIAECEEGYADEAVELLNQSFAQTMSYVRQYPFGVAKVENARLYEVGNTVMLIIAGADADELSDPEEAAKLAAAEYEKIDKALKELLGDLPENLIVIPEDTGNSGGGLLGG